MMRAPRFAADAVRRGQPAQQPATEELGHPRRRVEEVERVPGRRRVDDDQVVLAGLVDLEQSLHRDVVVALHEPLGEALVEPVVEDAVRRLLVGCVAHHQRVPALLRVEHRGPQLAARLEPGRRRTRRRARAARRCRCPRSRARRRGASRGRRSRRAPCRPSGSRPRRPTTAATEVLPTPPDPQKTTISFVASSASIDRDRVTAHSAHGLRRGSQAQLPVRRAPWPTISRLAPALRPGRRGTAGTASGGPPRRGAARAG